MKNNQKGFGVVELLLILILISILGFTGYYVYHTRNNANRTYNSAANASSSTKDSSVAQEFYFKEIGVYVKLIGAPLKGNLSYSLTSTDGVKDGVQYLDLYTPATKDAQNKCAVGTTDGGFMLISKVPGQFNPKDNPSTFSLKQFKDFWVRGVVPNGPVCDATASQADVDNWNTVSRAHVQAVMAAFKSATQ